MAPTLRTPTERTCERCGRTEIWDDDAGTWRVAEETAEDAGADSTDGRPVGSPYCIHEWDINGAFVPFDDVNAAEA
jgi:hypothetical protein